MYFQNFPQLSYPVIDGQRKTIQDIITRISFNRNTIDEISSFIIYNTPEGYLPEDIARDVYGDENYFWLVMLFNDFSDPIYSVPLSSRSLDKFIEKKYKSKTLFITPENDSEQFFSNNTSSRMFSEGDTITVYLGGTGNLKYKDSGGDKVLGVINKYIPELSAIQLESLQGQIKEGDIIVRGYDGEIRARVSRVTDSKYALSHFQNNKIRLNPMATPPDDNGNQIPVGQTGDGFFTPVGITQTLLENYMNDKTNLYVVTNEDREFLENEKNREIKLLNPRLLDSVVQEFREVLES